MLSYVEKENITLTLFGINIIIMGLVVVRLLVKSEARKLRKITPRNTIKQQIHYERIKAKYRAKKNFKPPILFQLFL